MDRPNFFFAFFLRETTKKYTQFPQRKKKERKEKKKERVSHVDCEGNIDAFH